MITEGFWFWKARDWWSVNRILTRRLPLVFCLFLVSISIEPVALYASARRAHVTYIFTRSPLDIPNSIQLAIQKFHLTWSHSLVRRIQKYIYSVYWRLLRPCREPRPFIIYTGCVGCASRQLRQLAENDESNVITILGKPIGDMIWKQRKRQGIDRSIWSSRSPVWRRHTVYKLITAKASSFRHGDARPAALSAKVWRA